MDITLQPGKVTAFIAFFALKGPGQPGRLVEASPTKDLFSKPAEQVTMDYISGKAG
jgi:phosphate transport system ATP-binding protein